MAGPARQVAPPGASPEKAPAAAPRVALVGVPNCGKSLIFNRLSGKFSTRASYPDTTSELEELQVVVNGRAVTLVDTPGITGLEFKSEEEAKTRELLRANPPDVIVQCVDAVHLLRSLILTAQLADLEIPTVVCLNMVDEAGNKGLFIDCQALSEQLGVPVVPVSALDGRGIKELAKKIEQARVPRSVSYPPYLEQKLKGQPASKTRATRVSAILDGELTRPQAGRSPWHMVLEAHHHWARGLVGQVTRQTGLEPKASIWSALAKVTLHPVGSWVFLILTLVAMYFLVVEVGAKFLSARIDSVITPLVGLISGWTGPGVVNKVLVGPFGLLTLGLFNAVGTVLPILAVFYLPFGLLEDIGYFPRLSVQFDRLLKVVGLNGKAILPITLGFGCSAVACMSIRRLETTKERFIAAFLIALGIPCAAQFGVVISILSTFPVVAIGGVLLIVVALQVVVGATLARLLPEKGKAEFLIELPPLRAPQWRKIFVRTYLRIAEFFTEAIPLFVASAAALLIMDFLGLLDRLRNVLAPVVVSGLGLPREYADVLLVTLARRELGAVMLKKMADSQHLEFKQVFVALLVMILYVPCMTTITVLARVLGWRRAMLVFAAVVTIAISTGAVVHWVWA
jgi:ferrous iron transport protein B